MNVYTITRGFFIYGEKTILKDVSFSISSGDRIVLRGDSGIGKSTLLSLLFGIEQWTAGDVIRNGSIHFQPQHDLLLPWKTVYENLRFTLGKECDFMPYLERCALSDAIHKKPYALSQGMRQRVTFLRTLLSGRDILLFDEPFANLDVKLMESLINLLKEEQEKRGCAIIVVTHNEHSAQLLRGKNWVISELMLTC